MIKLYFENNECVARAANLFNQRRADKYVSGKIVREWVEKFWETGYDQNKKRQVKIPYQTNM